MNAHSPGLPSSGLPSPGPTFRVTENSLFELSVEAERRGRQDLASDYLNKAIEAQQRGGTLLITPPGGAGGGDAAPSPFATRTSEGSPLLKAVISSEWGARPTPYRLSDALYTLGHYNGIRDLDEATNQTFDFWARVAQFPVIEAIIRTKVFQFTRFARVPLHARDTGFEVGLKDRNAPLTRAARKRQEELTNLFLSGGFYRLPDKSVRVHSKTLEPGVWDGLEREKARPFRDFVAAVMRDSYTFDWAVFRKEAGRHASKYPVVFMAPVQSKNVRRTFPERYGAQIINPREPVSFVELSPAGTGVIREFTWSTASALVRNPRDDIWGRGYGYSEIEVLSQIIAAMVMGLQFQKSFLDENHIPPGILSVNGNPIDVDEETMEGLRTQLLQYGGIGSAWKLLYMFFPAGQGNGVNFTALRDSMGASGSLQFAAQFWVALLNIVCAVYGISAEEIGFKGFTTQKATLSEYNPSDMLEYSQDKSTLPGLEALSQVLTTDVVERYDPDFELRFLNTGGKNQQEEDAHVQALMSRGFSMNQVADLLDEERPVLPVDPDLYNRVLRTLPERGFDTRAEHLDRVRDTYEEKFRKECPDDSISPWSIVPDLPGNPSLQSAYQQEVSTHQQAKQTAKQQKDMQEYLQKQGYPKDFDPQKLQQMAQMGLSPNYGAMGGDPNGGNPNGGNPNGGNPNGGNPNGGDPNAGDDANADSGGVPQNAAQGAAQNTGQTPAGPPDTTMAAHPQIQSSQARTLGGAKGRQETSGQQDSPPDPEETARGSRRPSKAIREKVGR